MKRVLSLILAGVLCLGCLTACGGNGASASSSAASSSAAKKTTFTVGFDQDFPPYGFVDDKGEFTGFDIDLAKEAASRMGLELKLQPIDWDAKDMELKTGAIDCIWNGFTMNGREDQYTWSVP